VLSRRHRHDATNSPFFVSMVTVYEPTNAGAGVLPALLDELIPEIEGLARCAV